MTCLVNLINYKNKNNSYMIEKKVCVICGFEVIILNCHYTCENCGFSENCHDIPHLIDDEKDNE